MTTENIHYITRHGEPSICDAWPYDVATTREDLTTCEPCLAALRAEREDMEPYEFYAEEILSRLRDDLPASYVEQTGGGTATLYIHKEEGDIALTAGPGSFNWGAPNKSRFFTGEFYAGMEDYKSDGEEFRDPEELGPPVPIGDMEALPVHFDRIAALFKEYHGIYNSGQYPR